MLACTSRSHSSRAFVLENIFVNGYDGCECVLVRGSTSFQYERRKNSAIKMQTAPVHKASIR